jgi:2,4-dienoyl-CoA reductase-like NADH-dependent reductase (Old Yellow Enzyme family)
MLTSCATHVQANGQGWAGEWGIFDDTHIDGWRRAAESLHEHGTLFFPQIFHAGMRADVSLISGTTVSCVDTEYTSRKGSHPVRGLSESEIEQLIEDFVAAAKRAESAGADGVEIHGAHGYILTQFLCPTLNTRDDKWGGSFENRARLTREVVRRIRAAVSKSFLVGVRLSPEPIVKEAGWNMDPDENVQLAKLLCEDGVDFISVSIFVRSNPATHVTKKHADNGETKPLLQFFREACPKDVVVMACGGVSEGADVAALHQLGIQVAVMGKTAVSTPDFPQRVQENPDYKVTVLPPYTKEHLVSTDHSEAFIAMLSSMGFVKKDEDKMEPTEGEKIADDKAEHFANPVVFKNGMKAKNGIAVAALTNGASNADGTVSDAELKWLTRRAQGGFGMITSCATHVQANGQGWAGEWGIFDDTHIDGWRRAAESLHEQGTLFLPQIFHAGMRADVSLISGTAVSCVDTEYTSRKGSPPVRGLSESEIEQLIDDFVAAAKRAESAGADGVEIHGAHGYILTQFLCPTLNTRDDKWGGSFENRARLTREVVRRIRAAVSKSFLVGVRLSPEPIVKEAGWNMDPDENVQLAKLLCEDGVDFISVSIFVRSNPASHVTKKHADNGETKPLLQIFREACPKDVVVMACGGVSEGADVAALHRLGIQVAVMGKTAVSTPDFPQRVQENPDYKVTVLPPYTKEHLVSTDHSEAFIAMLSSMGFVKKD